MYCWRYWCWGSHAGRGRGYCGAPGPLVDASGTGAAEGALGVAAADAAAGRGASAGLGGPAEGAGAGTCGAVVGTGPFVKARMLGVVVVAEGVAVAVAGAGGGAWISAEGVIGARAAAPLAPALALAASPPWMKAMRSLGKSAAKSRSKNSGTLGGSRNSGTGAWLAAAFWS